MEGRRKHAGLRFGLAPHSSISVSPRTLMILGVFMGTTVASCHGLAACTLDALAHADGCRLCLSLHNGGRKQAF